MPDKFRKIQRDSCISIRSKLPKFYQNFVSEKINKRIMALQEYRQAKHIALYQAFHGEVNLSHIWNSAPAQGKSCYFPIINEQDKLIFLPATQKTAFKKNHFGILEPDVDSRFATAISDLDLIFMPLVCFDLQGTRLGMGKGYYDRALANQSYKRLIGLAYEFQKEDFIQAAPWDISLSMVITEKETYLIKSI